MADAKVNIIITAKDQATGVLKGIGGLLGGLGKFALGGVIAGFGALATGVGIAINEATDAQKIMAQLNNVLASTGGAAGVTADAATSLADSLGKVTTFEDDAILGGENLLLTFTNIGKDIFPQVTETMLDMSTAMGQDLKSSALQLGKALQDPVTGMSALRRVGVNFTDEQENMVKKLMESGDLMGAQTLILQELQKEFGGSAKAAGSTFAGQLEILKNSMLNLAEEAGTQLLPILTEGLKALTPIIVDLVTRFTDFVQSDQFKAWLASVVIVLQQVGAWLSENLPPAIEALAGFWTNTLQPALASVWSFIQVNVIPILQQVWDWLVVNLPPALATLAAWWTNTLQPALAQVWSFIQANIIPILQQIWDWLATNLPPAIQALADFWTNVLWPALQKVWQFLTVDMMPVWKALGELIGTWLVKAFEGAVAVWNGLLKPALEAIWAFVSTYILPIFQSWWESIGGIGGAIETVVGWINTLTEALKSIKIPDWLTPGSPTPFETGLRGIAKAMKDLDGMTGNMTFIPPGLAYAQAGTSVNNYSLTVNNAGRTVDTMGKFSQLRAMARH